MKFLPKLMETTPGHLYQERKNQRSTKSIIKKMKKAQFVKIITPQEEGKIHTDQTGRFPTTSSIGYKYILILYDQDRNSILAEPLKSKNQDDQLRAIKLLVKNMEEREINPGVHWLDNEAPKHLR